jgi:hypothetical protein
VLLKIRHKFVYVEDRSFEAGQWHEDAPLRKVAAVMVVNNPLVGTYQQDLSPFIEESAEFGKIMGSMLLEAMGSCKVESYGKGGVVGLGGEIEHANMLLTTTFANPVRDAIGGAAAWISSFTKRAAPGATIDVPLNHKDAVYVRSHYGGMTIRLPDDCPDSDEVALIFCATNRGRLNARVGGLRADQVSAFDGLR